MDFMSWVGGWMGGGIDNQNRVLIFTLRQIKLGLKSEDQAEEKEDPGLRDQNE